MNIFLGILRGSGSMYKRCKKLNYNFYYADHAYFYNDDFPKQHVIALLESPCKYKITQLQI